MCPNLETGTLSLHLQLAFVTLLINNSLAGTVQQYPPRCMISKIYLLFVVQWQYIILLILRPGKCQHGLKFSVRVIY